MTVRRYTGFSALICQLRYAWSEEGRRPLPEITTDVFDDMAWQARYDLRWKPWTWWRSFTGAVVVDDQEEFY